MYYVYVDYTVDTHEPFYVGKGNEGRAKSLGGRNKKHTSVTLKHGQNRVILVEADDEKLTFQREIDFITRTDGGESPTSKIPASCRYS